jgi:hypothetical protein
MKRILLVLVALLLLAGGWYFGSPVWTLHRMGEAAEIRDGTTLAAFVDFPPLRESVKAQLKEQLASRVASGTDTGLAALGEVVAFNLVDSVVDGFVTPEAMIALFAHTPPAHAKPPFGASAADGSIHYEDVDHFSVALHGKGGGDGGRLVFVRHGLGWKLADFRLPPGAIGGAKA